MGHLDGLKLDAAYEYFNWYNSGWVGGFIAKQGYYIADPKTAKNPHRERVGLLLRRQGSDRRHHLSRPAKDQFGRRQRDGGSFEERFSQGCGVELP